MIMFVDARAAIDLVHVGVRPLFESGRVAGIAKDHRIRTEEPIMATSMTKSPRKAVQRRAGAQHISDHRYYVQCAYRLAMAVITLVALFVITHGG